ncbi:MAG: phospho-sugar mutase [Flavobacteriaceae bacterium]|nr:phospho-sugar mutase [Flavobacteriaceae bacterium]
MSKSNIDNEIAAWQKAPFDAQTQREVAQLAIENPLELEDAFYKNLAFGTGGMRGLMGVGPNRINAYTLGRNTQGISNYLKKQYPNEPLSVAIAYDCRHQSDRLAQIVANVFSANNINAHLFPELRTTPALSFTLKHLKCQAGIVLTASHNPPEYNGYKVYWTDGGQIVPPEDQEIIKEIESLSFEAINFTPNKALIKTIDASVDEAFITQSCAQANFNAPNKEGLKIVFTSLHGTSITAIPAVLEKAGYTVNIVKEQAVPDGDFPTVSSPNPEEPEALAMALALGEKTQADIVIGTDPDSDRLGVAVRGLGGQLQLLNGNQCMVLMTAFLLEKRKEQGLVASDYIASTIVSTPMMEAMAAAYNIECKTTLTGFKWIADEIKKHPDQHFIGGGEESFGFMVGDFVRDKDAVTASLLACEMASFAKAKGNTLMDELIDLYQEYGCYQEHLIAITKKGKEGSIAIENNMKRLREQPLETIDGEKVVWVHDYLKGVATNLQTNDIQKIALPTSNVLIYTTEKGTKLASRPSGTEPKIKFYISVNKPLDRAENYPKVKEALDLKINNILKEIAL